MLSQRGAAKAHSGAKLDQTGDYDVQSGYFRSKLPRYRSCSRNDRWCHRILQRRLRRAVVAVFVHFRRAGAGRAIPGTGRRVSIAGR